MGRASPLHERILISLIRDGQWEIDEQGRVWRISVRRGLRAGGSHLLACARRRVEHRLPQGYLQVRAEVEGRRFTCGAHRLVWQHANGDISPGHEINHRNGLKDDNRPSNLLCGTAGENVEHAHRAGLVDQFGQRNPSAKLTDNQVAQIRLAYSQGGYTMVQLGQRFGVTFQTISKVVRGQRRHKQGGPVSDKDLRHNASDRDPQSGQFVAGRHLDGVEHNGMPRMKGVA